MLKIGDFSKLTRVSVKMLRHYDDLDLLKPAQVDPFTGYRYYAADQLPRLNRIIALKDIGFSLDEIHHLLDGDVTADQIRGMLKVKQMEVEQRLRAEQNRLALIENRLLQMEGEAALLHYDVVVRSIEATCYATIRQIIPDASRISSLFDTAEAHVARNRARAARPPLAIFYDSGYQEQDMDVEVAVPLTGCIPDSNLVRVRELPGTPQMACVVHTGSYITIERATNTLMTWIDAHDYTIIGPIREVYLRFGADEFDYTIPTAYLAASKDEFVTELQLPVEKIHKE